MLRRALILPLFSVLGLPLAGCADRNLPTAPSAGSSASFAKEPGEPETKKLFKEYVAMGSSIAAGFMSGGINDSTQLLAYPVILADRGDAKKFDVPLLAKPGCPATVDCADHAFDPDVRGAGKRRPSTRRQQRCRPRNPRGGGVGTAIKSPLSIYSLLLGGTSEVGAMLGGEADVRHRGAWRQRRLRGGAGGDDRSDQSCRRQRAHAAGQLPILVRAGRRGARECQSASRRGWLE